MTTTPSVTPTRTIPELEAIVGKQLTDDILELIRLRCPPPDHRWPTLSEAPPQTLTWCIGRYQLYTYLTSLRESAGSPDAVSVTVGKRPATTPDEGDMYGQALGCRDLWDVDQIR